MISSNAVRPIRRWYRGNADLLCNSNIILHNPLTVNAEFYKNTIILQTDICNSYNLYILLLNKYRFATKHSEFEKNYFLIWQLGRSILS